MSSEVVTNDAAAVAGTAELGEVLRDYMEITQRLQNTHENLQREVVRLRDELASKDRELEVRRRLSALGELAAGLAHEVRNPLGAIQLYNGLLRKQCHRLEPALELINKIDLGIRAIDGVVQDTLALAPRGPRRVSRPLQAVIADACDNCRQQLQDHQININVLLAAPDECVAAETAGLQRILVNLIVNAAEASPPGSTVTVMAGEPRQDEVELRVIDEGTGLADEALDRLFDPFFTTKERGTGLGLTIAHRLVEAYGGRLAASNRPEGGAEFTVVLPAVDDADPARETSAA